LPTCFQTSWTKSCNKSKRKNGTPSYDPQNPLQSGKLTAHAHRKTFVFATLESAAKNTSNKLKPGVHFINILRKHLVPIFWHQKLQKWNITREPLAKHFCMKNAPIKCWWNWLHGSISLTYYERLFAPVDLCSSFWYMA